MHFYGVTLLFLLPPLAHSAAVHPSDSLALREASPLNDRDFSVRRASSPSPPLHEHGYTPDAVFPPVFLIPRDGDHHHHHGPARTELDEADASPPPPSYYTVDFDSDADTSSYPGLMFIHVLSMCAAFFAVLPAGIALRSVRHPWHASSVIAFWILIITGCASSSLYRKLTPNMYDGQVHSIQSYFVLLIALVLSMIDFGAGIGRLIVFLKGVRHGDPCSLHAFWHRVVLGQDDVPSGHRAEYANLVVSEPEELELEEDPKSHMNRHDNERHVVFDHDQEDQEYRGHESEEAEWVNQHPETPNSDETVFRRVARADSKESDDTLHSDYRPRSFASKRRLIHRLGVIVFGTLERFLIFAAFGQFTAGIAIYMGGCRGYRINTCLAHVIKGGIFWCYGLVTFARFLGAFSDLGWAWNRAPKGRPVSAEFVESIVIFVYGITNTWMERFGAAPGSPYTTKQIQHISIALMFWFAGLVGMGMESRRFRRWLSSISVSAVKPSERSSGAVAEPASYIGSYNPFPALCIGVTGIAMSAHAQDYVFQVQIHALWGYCLAGFAILRWMTYFFVWLSPPRSILPSRPPSEAVASFFLACGGLVFILSSEEITIGAMRLGHDDVMMFANAAVAITCLAFLWTMCVVGFKAWLKTSTFKPVAYHASA